ncbi:hypothetical protein CF336_g9646 [Tilletia laevis]|nr:hypothetical protein CF336_g9646 [Tilletia laevis]KAE8179870.1 hypothetical protein CF335_g9440 [Tilletia laevis]
MLSVSHTLPATALRTIIILAIRQLNLDVHFCQAASLAEAAAAAARAEAEAAEAARSAYIGQAGPSTLPGTSGATSLPSTLDYDAGAESGFEAE